MCNTLFADKIRELRLQGQIPQRKMAAVLDIDTATYCKIEKGERKARKEQIPIIAKQLNALPDDLLSLWLADRISDVVSEEYDVAPKVLRIVSETLKKTI